VAWREAVLQVAGRSSARAAPPSAVGLLANVLERDPLAEDALQAYLRCAEAPGQRAAALRAFETFRVSLRDELELAPLEATSPWPRPCARRDAEGDADPAPPRAAPPPPPAAPAPSGPPAGRLRGFPAPITPFVGREAELEGWTSS
jgi:hypothetical protein